MDYKEFVFTITAAEEYQRDILIHGLGDIGFDTFEETDTGFKAYIASEVFNEQIFNAALDQFKFITYSYIVNLIPQTNWNEVWESNFEPININDSCYVRATFHTPQPQFRHEIIIEPKMAFGTGHHQTTALMMELMLKEDFNGKSVLDMGCGTGILAILAQKLGAKKIIAIDYDELCYQSTLENSVLNNATTIKAIYGSKENIPAEKFDIILANINRNILLEQIDAYANALQGGGSLFMSGFYEKPDLQILIDKAKQYNVNYAGHQVSADWVAAKFLY